MGVHVLVGYLIGLSVVQLGIAVGAGWLTERLMKAVEARDISVRIAGALVAGASSLLVLENLEGVAFAALGLAS